MPKASPKRAVVEAARNGSLDHLKRLRQEGVDLNTSYANYRPLHSLIQTDPHREQRRPSAERLRCLDWLLANGADPELTGGWPPARAMVIAGFTGIPEYVERLKDAGVRLDGFGAAALGEVAGVKRALRADAG